MIELGQLERRHEDFAKHDVRVIAVSVDGLDDSKKTKEQFPSLLVLSDHDRGLTDAAGVLHQGEHGPDGTDVDAPTTILVNRKGKVRWLYRSGSVVARLSPDDVLKAIDENMAEK
jgi:peroxiredoxin